MADALPPSIAAQIRDMERRIAVLERSNKLITSTLVGGQLRILDDDGNEIIVMGMLDPVANGMRINTTDGDRFFQVDQLNGYVLPWLVSPWRPYDDGVTVYNAAGFATASTGTFQRMWHNTSEIITATEMLFRIYVITPSGTTGEVRVYHAAVGQIGGTQTLASATDREYEFRLQHGLTFLTGPHQIYVEARVTGGAGVVTIYEPSGIHWGGVIGSVSGGWVP